MDKSQQSSLVLARVTNFDIGFEDHGTFGFNVDFELEGGLHQGTGWYALESSAPIKNLLRVMGRDRVNKAPGALVHLLRDNSRMIQAIQTGPFFPANQRARLVLASPKELVPLD